LLPLLHPLSLSTKYTIVRLPVPLPPMDTTRSLVVLGSPRVARVCPVSCLLYVSSLSDLGECCCCLTVVPACSSTCRLSPSPLADFPRAQLSSPLLVASCRCCCCAVLAATPCSSLLFIRCVSYPVVLLRGWLHSCRPRWMSPCLSLVLDAPLPPLHCLFSRLLSSPGPLLPLLDSLSSRAPSSPGLRC
jgi:hypothetical protein